MTCYEHIAQLIRTAPNYMLRLCQHQISIFQHHFSSGSILSRPLVPGTGGSKSRDAGAAKEAALLKAATESLRAGLREKEDAVTELVRERVDKIGQKYAEFTLVPKLLRSCPLCR